MTIEQMEELAARVHKKTIPLNGWLPNTLIWRSEAILRRLVVMIREQRIQEGRYYNGL